MKIKGHLSNSNQNFRYEACQTDIAIDESLRFVVQFPQIQNMVGSPCKSYLDDDSGVNDCHSPKAATFSKTRLSSNSASKSTRDLISKEDFKLKMNQNYSLTDRIYIGKMDKKELSSRLAKIVPCIGCRKSVETLYDILLDKGWNKNHEIFSNILIDRSTCNLKLCPSILNNDEQLFDYLYDYSSRCKDLVGGLKVKKSRCSLHGLESRANYTTRGKLARSNQGKNSYGHDDDSKFNPETDSPDDFPDVCLGYFGLNTPTSREDMKNCWVSIWNSLTPSCKSAVCTINLSRFRQKIDEYLDRHSFCGECKMQIHAAYHYLTSADRPLAGTIMHKAAGEVEKSIKKKVQLKMKSTQRKIIKEVGVNSVQSLLNEDSCTDSDSDRKVLSSESSVDVQIDKDFSSAGTTPEISENSASETDGSYDSDENSSDQNHNHCGEECHDKCTCFEWNPVLFSGIKYLEKEQSLKVTVHDQHIVALLKKAESEMISNMLSGGSHARHAKTNIQAQNEVIIIAGIFLYERLHKIWLKMSEISLAGKFLAFFHSATVLALA